MLSRPAVGKTVFYAAAVPLLAECVTCGPGDSAPPDGRGAMYGELVLVGTVVAVALLAWELGARIRRYDWGPSGRGAVAVAVLLFVVGLASLGAVVALSIAARRRDVGGLRTRNAEECFVGLLVPIGVILALLVGTAWATVATGIGLLAGRTWAGAAAFSIAMAVAVAGLGTGLVNEDGGGLVVGSAAALVVLAAGAGGRLLWMSANAVMALSSLALPSGAVHRKARFLAVVPLLASCEVCTVGDTGPPTGVGAFYGTLAALGLVVVVLVVGGELVRRLRRYRFGAARPGAWFAGSLLVVTVCAAAGAAVATVGYLAVGASSVRHSQRRGMLPPNRDPLRRRVRCRPDGAGHAVHRHRCRAARIPALGASRRRGDPPGPGRRRWVARASTSRRESASSPAPSPRRSRSSGWSASAWFRVARRGSDPA